MSARRSPLQRQRHRLALLVLAACLLAPPAGARQAGAGASAAIADGRVTALLQLTERIQTDPSQAPALEQALDQLADLLRQRGDQEAGLEVWLQLAKIKFERGDFAGALPLLQEAQPVLVALQERDPDAGQRRPAVLLREETEYAIAASLHHLQQVEAAEPAYSALISRMQRTPTYKTPVLAVALHNAASLASQTDRPALALERITAAARLTAAMPDVDPQQLGERLAGLVRLSVNDSGELPRREDVDWALASAAQAGLAQRAPTHYLELVLAAANFYAWLGDAQQAARMAALVGAADAGQTGVAVALRLVLELQRLELAAQAGDTGAYASGWAALRQRVLALPQPERERFALRAHALTWESFGPALQGTVVGGDALARRARDVTEFCNDQLAPLLPERDPRQQTMRVRLASWTLVGGDTSAGQAALERLLGDDGDSEEDAANRAFAMQMLSFAAAAQGQGELAILWGKQALNGFRDLPAGALQRDCSASLCLNVAGMARGGSAGGYRWVSALLIREGRLPEAQQLLQMLREQELTDSLRGAADGFAGTRATLTGLEQRRFADFYLLRARQAALAAERTALQRQRDDGRLERAGSARLRHIDQVDAPTLRRAMARFLRGLDQAMRAGADRDAVQNSDSVMREASQIQRDIDRLAQWAPEARAVGVQYLVEPELLSILVTVPGLPPIARQVALSRTALYGAVTDAQLLLRTPKSAPQALRAALQTLYDMLIAPIAADLRAAGAATLMLSLDDRLRQVAFAALLDADQHYLVQRYALALYNEGGGAGAQDSAGRNWRVAAMGMSRPTGGLPALATVPAELRAVVAAARGGGRTYLDGQFTRQALDQVLLRRPPDGATDGFNVLHLASHFVLRPGNANASMLYLGEGAPLSLAEMATRRLDFRGFALVVYSACDSGVPGGRDANGMEMESLSALTRRNGAGAVLGTLWRVSDASVATAMAAFYRASARDDASLAAALRQTQLGMLQDKAGTFAHPFHWAPFVLMGNWR